VTTRRLHEEDFADGDWFVPNGSDHPEQVLARLRVSSATVALTTVSGETWVGIGARVEAADNAINLSGWGAPPRAFPVAGLAAARVIAGYIPREAQTPILTRQARGEPAHREAKSC
jgi:hypothetical protein